MTDEPRLDETVRTINQVLGDISDGFQLKR